MFAPGPTANADPSAHTWYRLRMCESSNNYKINTGNGYYGAYQFDLSTWRSVGGSGYPNQASPAEQDARALILYRMRGWQPWTCAGILGLREDADAGSGRTGDIHIGGCGRPAPAVARPRRSHQLRHPGVPRQPLVPPTATGTTTSSGSRTRCTDRGFFPAGTGQYGPLTLAMVKRLQALNGLIPNGLHRPEHLAAGLDRQVQQPARPDAHPTPQPRPKPRRTPSRRQGAVVPGPATCSTTADEQQDIKRFQDQMHSRGVFPRRHRPVRPAHPGDGQEAAAGQRAHAQRRHRPEHVAARVDRQVPAPSSRPRPRPAQPHTTASVPRFPGMRWYRFGDWSREDQACSRTQMHHRGFFPAGTGQYGPKTLRMVKQLQRLNGLIPNGLIGPKTWRLAWTGKYNQP